MPQPPISVPRPVYLGLEAIRLSGLINMFNCLGVIKLADHMGFQETAEWIRDHRQDFAQLLIHGVVIEKEES